MENSERVDSPVDALTAAIHGVLKGVFFALPASITKQSNGHTTQMVSTIKGLIRAQDGSSSTTEITIMDDAPVHFAGGGGVTATHPVTTGDEGVAFFMSRPQDTWHQSGGIQDPIDSRMHDLSDGRFIPGGRSDPRKLSPAPSTTSHQTRSDNGQHVNDVHPTNGLTSTSTVKHVVTVGQSSTSHLPDKLIKVATKLLLNCVPSGDIQPGNITMANRKAIAPKPPPAIGPMANSISSALAGVLSGGAASILTNPTAAANTALAAATTSGAAAITSAIGAPAAALVAAMTGGSGLTAQLSSLTGVTNNLSGLTAPTGGAFGLADLLNHATLIDQYFGATVPTAVALSAAAGPIQSASTLATMEASVNSIVSQVIAGTMTVSAGTAAINAVTAQIAGLMSASTTSISTLQASALALSNVSAIAAAANAFGANEAALGALMGGSSTALASLSSAMAAIWTPTSDETAAMTSFPDAGADQQGATGSL